MSAPDQDTPPEPTATDPLLGAVLGDRYRVVEVLGLGGMGAVYRGEHVALPRRVAIKVLHPEMCALPEAVGRFEREARAAAVLDHPNVVAVTDFGRTADGRLYLVMEYIEGVTLRAALDAAGALDLARLANLARQLGAALERAHALGIVHRDLKPENIMLVPREDGTEAVKVVDFGIAKVPAAQRAASDRVQTRAGLVYGTFEYMPPEQALGAEVDAAADIYALGVILFEALTGQRPFDDENTVTLLAKQMSEPVPRASERRPGGAPREVDRVLDAMMAKTPAARPPTVRAAVDAFLAALQRPSVIAATPIAPSPPRPSRAKGLAAALMVGLPLLGGAAWLLTRDRGAVSAAPDARVAPARDAAVAAVTARDAGVVTARDAGVAAPSGRERVRLYLAMPQTREGIRRAQRGEYAAIARAFEQVWRETGDVSVAYVLGLIASQSGRHDVCVQWFERALRADASLAEDAGLARAVVRAYTEGRPAEGSEALLTGPLRASAAAPLREVARSGRAGAAAERAARLLASPSFRELTEAGAPVDGGAAARD